MTTTNTINADKARALKALAELEQDKVDNFRATIADANEDLVHVIEWQCEDALYSAILASELQHILRVLTDEDSSATPASVRRWIDDQIERWSPNRSTSPISNFSHEERLRANKRVRELLFGDKYGGGLLRDEANEIDEAEES